MIIAWLAELLLFFTFLMFFPDEWWWGIGVCFAILFLSLMAICSLFSKEWIPLAVLLDFVIGFILLSVMIGHGFITSQIADSSIIRNVLMGALYFGGISGSLFSAIGISLKLRKKRWWEGYSSYIGDIWDETEFEYGDYGDYVDKIYKILGVIFILLFPLIIKTYGIQISLVGVGMYYALIVCWILGILIHFWLQLWAAKVSINCRTQKGRKKLKIIGILLVFCFYPPISTVGLVFLIMNWKKISYENIDYHK